MTDKTQPLTTHNLDSLQPHERAFHELTERQSELLDEQHPSDVLAAVIACGMFAQTTVPDEYQPEVARKTAEILQRLSLAGAVLDLEPKGQA